MNQDLEICDQLITYGKLNVSKYCAPIYIANLFTGIALAPEKLLAPEKIGDHHIRNGTMTFVEFEGEYYAITNEHVIRELERQKELFKTHHKQKYNFSKPIETHGFVTPKDNTYHHLNYDFTIIPQDELREPIDIAIAKIDPSWIKKIERSAISLTKNTPPNSFTGIVSGYAETQRKVRQDKLVSVCVECIGNLQQGQGNSLIVEGEIQTKTKTTVDELSGMSGGPIIWSTKNEFGLTGITYRGQNIKDHNSIYVEGEKVSVEKIKNWTDLVPEILKTEDRSKQIIASIPST